jgi:hypothetical protein
MSTDLHIHILQGVTEYEVLRFDLPSVSDNWEFREGEDENSVTKSSEYHKLYDKISKTPNIWIGEVSWAKASLFEDSDTFIPDTILKIEEILDEYFQIITDELIKEIADAFDLPNNTIKKDGVWSGNGYSLAKKDDVVKFLKQYIGYKIFTVSW